MDCNRARRKPLAIKANKSGKSKIKPASASVTAIPDFVRNPKYRVMMTKAIIRPKALPRHLDQSRSLKRFTIMAVDGGARNDQNSLYTRIRELLSNKSLAERGIYRPEEMLRDVEAHRAGKVNISNRVFRIVQLELFCGLMENGTSERVESPRRLATFKRRLSLPAAGCALRPSRH